MVMVEMFEVELSMKMTGLPDPFVSFSGRMVDKRKLRGVLEKGGDIRAERSGAVNFLGSRLEHRVLLEFVGNHRRKFSLLHPWCLGFFSPPMWVRDRLRIARKSLAGL